MAHLLSNLIIRETRKEANGLVSLCVDFIVDHGLASCDDGKLPVELQTLITCRLRRKPGKPSASHNVTGDRDAQLFQLRNARNDLDCIRSMRIGMKRRKGKYNLLPPNATQLQDASMSCADTHRSCSFRII